MAIENLVMPDDRKMMIKALVEKFSRPGRFQGAMKQWRADWIENKGEGQIFLLHGSPGVGKTFVSVRPMNSCEASLPCILPVDSRYVIYRAQDSLTRPTRSIECIAEFTERPLLSLTTGDIGSFADAAERRLSKWFTLAERWVRPLLNYFMGRWRNSRQTEGS